jgi:aspartate 1-decarboxylase
MTSLEILHSKIHNVKVTEANLNYVGSITIDSEIMETADLIRWQKVFIVNNNNGARFETYVIPGKRGSRRICLNGSAARQVQVGDEIIIMNFHLVNLDECYDRTVEDYRGNTCEKYMSNEEWYVKHHCPRVVMLNDEGVLTIFNALGEDDQNFIKK